MTDEEAQEHNGMERVKREALRLEELKKQRTEIEAEIVDVEKYLDKAIENSITFDDEVKDQAVFVTIVRGTVDRFDEFLIRTKYPKVWRSITKPVIDKELYRTAFSEGAITPEMHAKFHHASPKKSYVKISRRNRHGESE